METDQGLMGVDPAVAVGVTLIEAEVLRLEAAAALAAFSQPGDSLIMRDLSPLGRR